MPCRVRSLTRLLDSFRLNPEMKAGLSTEQEGALYEATRRLSSWAVMLLECTWIHPECRADLRAWLDAIPRDWWSRFPVDDANERRGWTDAH